MAVLHCSGTNQLLICKWTRFKAWFYLLPAMWPLLSQISVCLGIFTHKMGSIVGLAPENCVRSELIYVKCFSTCLAHSRPTEGLDMPSFQGWNSILSGDTLKNLWNSLRSSVWRWSDKHQGIYISTDIEEKMVIKKISRQRYRRRCGKYLFMITLKIMNLSFFLINCQLLPFFLFWLDK